MLKNLLSKTGMFFLNSLSLLPLNILYLLADLAYILLFYVIKYRRKVVLENLHNSFPEKSDTEINAIERRYYKHLSSLMVEILKMASQRRS
jgi:KDO2-lipid IV(A) lauroyltransferase